MSFLFKKTVTKLILISFLMTIFFGFAAMMHGPDKRMQDNCPFLVMGSSLCPQNTVAMVFHDISAYQSFIHVPTTSGIMTLIISLFLLVILVLTVFIGPPLFGPRILDRVLYNFPSNTSYRRKVTYWLALHENSPPFVLGR